MPSPSPEIVQLLSAFAVVFTAPTYRNALILLYGTLLGSGRRTVTSALRAMGLNEERQFCAYHRVLSRATWSPKALSRILLSLLVATFVPMGAALIIVVDETIEARKGKRIKNKGWFRDAVRSGVGQINYVLGIRWIVLALVVTVPWSRRPWACPFLAVPSRSPKTAKKLGKRNWTVVQWTAHLIGWVRRWQPEREIVVIGDGAYAAINLIQRCQQLPQPVKLVSRLRLDAQLYDAPPLEKPKGSRGPKPKKGERQPQLAERLVDPQTQWQTLTLPWYAEGMRCLEYVTGTSLWHRPGEGPVPLRWVLVRCPQGRFKPSAFFCSDVQAAPEQIVAWFILRWNIEVTFEEVRAFLGLGTQRHWSDRAIERTTPCLLGLFSLVTLMAHRLHGDQLPKRADVWYQKQDASFSDALAAVRLDILHIPNYLTSSAHDDLALFPTHFIRSLISLAAHAA
jgi:hypothetical protein